MSYPLNTLQIHPFSGSMASIPWRFVTEHASQKGDYLMGPDGVTMTETLEINWGDLKSACTALVGYSYRNVQGTAAAFPNYIPQQIIGAVVAGPLIFITTAQPHHLIIGDTIFIWGVVGLDQANGRTQVFAAASANVFTIAIAPTLGPPGSYTGGGTWIPTGSHLSRVLPWQHPIFNQMWVKRIVSIHGRQQQGTSENVPVGVLLFALLGANGLGGVGPGNQTNAGPWVNFSLAEITVEFWRPPYALRTDADVWNLGAAMDDGNIADIEWTRYTDRQWELSTQLLSRDDTSFAWADPTLTTPPGNWATPASTPIRGGVGQKVSHLRMTKKWYQVPESCLFLLDGNGVPTNLPITLLLQQNQVTNPITGRETYGGEPICGSVNSPMGGGTIDSYSLRFLGTPQGELLYEGVVITVSPLQLPPELMQIATLKGSTEPLSQCQYDIEFHFDRFDPPRGAGVPFHGHNLVPWTGDGLWYPVTGQRATVGGKKSTMFQYADLSDLFQVL